FRTEGVVILQDPFLPASGESPHEPIRVALLQEPLEVGIEQGQHVRGEEVAELSADQFFRLLVSQVSNHGPVDTKKLPLQIMREDESLAVFHKVTIALLTLPHFPPPPLSLLGLPPH